jgi:hypothetical protein
MKIEEYFTNVTVAWAGGTMFGAFKGWGQANEIHSGNLKSNIGKPTTISLKQLRIYTMFQQGIRYGLNLAVFSGLYFGVDSLLDSWNPFLSKGISGVTTGALFGVFLGMNRKGYSKMSLIGFGSSLGGGFGLVHQLILQQKDNLLKSMDLQPKVNKEEVDDLKNIYEAQELSSALEKYVKDEIAIQETLHKILTNYEPNSKLDDLEKKVRKEKG